MNLTKERLKSIANYNPETGVFTKIKTGKAMGYTSNHGYIVIVIDSKKHYAHRAAFLYMDGEIPKLVDHINRDRSDNRWCNLRPSNKQLNSRNSKIRATNTSGITGVNKIDRIKGWSANITVNYKPIHLGYFKNKDDAKLARLAAERKYNYHD